MAACQNGAGAKKGRKKLYECQVQFVQDQGHLVLPYQCSVCSRNMIIQIYFSQIDDLPLLLKRNNADGLVFSSMMVVSFLL